MIRIGIILSTFVVLSGYTSLPTAEPESEYWPTLREEKFSLGIGIKTTPIDWPGHEPGHVEQWAKIYATLQKIETPCSPDLSERPEFDFHRRHDDLMHVATEAGQICFFVVDSDHKIGNLTRSELVDYFLTANQDLQSAQAEALARLREIGPVKGRDALLLAGLHEAWAETANLADKEKYLWDNATTATQIRSMIHGIPHKAAHFNLIGDFSTSYPWQRDSCDLPVQAAVRALEESTRLIDEVAWNKFNPVQGDGWLTVQASWVRDRYVPQMLEAQLFEGMLAAMAHDYLVLTMVDHYQDKTLPTYEELYFLLAEHLTHSYNAETYHLGLQAISENGVQTTAPWTAKAGLTVYGILDFVPPMPEGSCSWAAP